MLILKMQPRSLAVLFFAVLTALVSEKRAIAQITPDATLGSEASIVAPDADVRGGSAELIQGGATRGVNLFHSFADFNVAELQRVYFANPIGIENILGRVTGSSASNILGTLGVDGSANLFLLNPNGIVFGPNAQLDITGSFVASTAAAFDFNGQLFSATDPTVPTLLTVSLTPGLQYSAAQRGEIRTQAVLAAGQDLRLDGVNLDLSGELTAGRNLVLQAQERAQIRDSVASPFIAAAGGELEIQGNEQIDIFTLAHPESGLFAGSDLILRSGSPVIGDAYFWSGGSFRVEQLDGSANSLLSPNDPVIRAGGDVSFSRYEGASLHVLARGSVTIGDVIINGVDSANFLRETVSLSRTLPDGTDTVQIDGSAQPTLDIRAGVTNVGAPVGLTGSPAPNGLQLSINQPERADIAVDRITIEQPNGLVFLSNQYRPNDLAGAISVRGIDTRNASGSGDVVIDSRSDITLNSYGAIRTNGRPDTVGAAGDVNLIAAGDVTLAERSLIQTRAYGDGAGGDITVLARGLTMNNRTQLDTSTRGTGLGGDINLNLRGALTLRGTNTRIVSLVEPGAIANSGDINIRAGSLAVTNGAGIYNGVRGTGNAGAINIRVRDEVVIDGFGGGSNSAIINSVLSGGTGGSGDIDLQAGSLSLIDGGMISTQIGVDGDLEAQGSAGNLNLAVRDNVLISGPAIDKTLPDADIQAPPVVGTVDVFFLADNTSSMRSIITAVRSNASDVLTALAGDDPRFSEVSVNFGVGQYQRDPRESSSSTTPYRLQQSITESASEAQTAINDWSAFGGGDRPEGNFFALQQVATSGASTDAIGGTDPGIATNQATGWRNNAERVIIWFGDAVSHTTTVDQTEAINALVTNDIQVAAINTLSSGTGIDANGQASAIAIATGGSLANNVNTANVADTILTAVDESLFPDYTLVNGPSSTTNIPSGLYTGGLTTGGIGGNLQLEAGSLQVLNSGFINNAIAGSGAAGTADINVVGTIEVGNGGQIASNTAGSGAGGDLTLTAEQLLVRDNAQIIASSISDGVGAALTINVADSITVANSGGIGTTSLNAGAAGDITLTGRRLFIRDGSIINSSTLGSENAGDITARFGNLVEITNSSQFSADTFGSGRGGSLNLNTRLLRLSGSEISAATVGTGPGGSLNVTASDAVELVNSSLVTATIGTAPAGDVSVNTRRLTVRDGGGIEAGTTGTGAGGNVNVVASESIELTGTSEPITLEDLEAAIASNPVARVIFSDGEVDPSQLPGQFGINIIVNDPNFSGVVPSKISTLGQLGSEGNSGNISVTTGNFTVSNGAEVATAAFGDGDGGQVNLQANNLTIANTGRVISRAQGQGTAGGINIQVNNSLTASGGEISASSDRAGGGNIGVNAGVFFLNRGSLVSSSVFDSTGGGGNIDISSSAFVAIEDSDILANAEFGPGGNISINSPAFLADLFSNSRATPVGRNPGSFAQFRGNGRVDISVDSASGTSGNTSLPDLVTDEGLAELPIDLSDPTGLIDRSCQALGRSERNEFVVTGQGGLPSDPSQRLEEEGFLEDLGPHALQQDSLGGSQPASNLAEPPERIIEPQGWTRDETGEIRLVATVSAAAPDLHEDTCRVAEEGLN
ncbi:filamentous hemagglutinin N-terminal domain-containing protein [Sphaerothrix gracilis]|uniref:two-partner secretion domain-containing protein n=1 Tax=Sphaerothrix gracilis TaxID=3151835 RepID=UPI0031FD679B